MAGKKLKLVIGLKDKEIMFFAKERLKESFDVESVEDSEGAYHVIHTFKPDMAILDFSLDKIHPIELYEGVSFIHPETHFVICVTDDNFKVAEKIWKKRSCDFIFKPFTLEQFVNDVNKIVRNYFDMKEIARLRKRVLELEAEIERIKRGGA